MAVTNYHTVNGRILGETTGGIRTDYLTDALGSVTATVNPSAQVVNRYTYKPYGGLLAKTGAGADPVNQWVGSLGYRQTGKKYSDVYVRARHYDTSNGRWTTKDPIGFAWGDWNVYRYVRDRVTSAVDPSGLFLDFQIGKSCHQQDRAMILNLMQKLCSQITKHSSKDRKVWDPIEKCVGGCSGGDLGPCQEDCYATWCNSWGLVKCDYEAACSPCSTKGGEPAACTQNGECSAPGSVMTLCMKRAFRNGMWNPDFGCHATNNPPYVGCRDCAGKEGMFYLLHELQHACGTDDETRSERKACCILQGMF
jgi:RHS repeat-associated protein